MAQKRSPRITGDIISWELVDERSTTKSGGEPLAPNAETPETVVRHPEFYFDNTLIVIQVENTLFNVHKYQLAKSKVFSDKFKMREPEGNEIQAGMSPERPIVLQGITATDFAALLKVLYASLFSSNQPVPDAALIIPTFRLANMLNFPELRTHLLPLAEKNLSDIDKIIFAREFDIKEWLAPAHINLCRREEPLSTEDASKLGTDSLLLMLRMRGQYKTSGRESGTDRYICSGCILSTTSGTCAGCGKSSSNSAYYYCKEPGSAAQKGSNPTINSDLEVEVKKWVENGCVLK